MRRITCQPAARVRGCGRLAGAPGFEPGNGGTKNRCLTTWRRPNPRNVLSRFPGNGKRLLKQRFGLRLVDFVEGNRACHGVFKDLILDGSLSAYFSIWGFPGKKPLSLVFYYSVFVSITLGDMLTLPAVSYTLHCSE